MLNADVVNAESSYFRRRIFANLLPFQVEFHDSKIRLNIFADRELTVKRCIPARILLPASCLLRVISTH